MKMSNSGDENFWMRDVKYDNIKISYKIWSFSGIHSASKSEAISKKIIKNCIQGFRKCVLNGIIVIPEGVLIE